MRSTATAIVAGSVILVAAIAVMIRLQKPNDLGGRSFIPERPSRSSIVGNRNRADSGSEDRVQERIRRLREQHAARHAERENVQAKHAFSHSSPRALPTPKSVAEDELEVAQLENTLINDPDPDERAGAAFFLSASDQEEAAYRALLRGLNDPDREVRLSIIEALEDFDDQISADALAPALNDPDPEVRFEVVSLLGDLETPDALNAVRGMLQDQDEDVRSLAEGIVELSE